MPTSNERKMLSSNEALKELTNTAAKIHLVYYTVTKADTDESREA